MGRPNSGPRLILIKRKTEAVWHVRWHERGHTRVLSTGSGDLEEAKRFLGEWLVDRGRSGPVAPRARRPDEATIADVLTSYAVQRGPQTASDQRITFAAIRLLEWWRDRRVEDVRPETCSAYVASRLKTVKVGTVRRELGVLRAALNHAVRNGRLTVAPYVQLPQKTPGRDRWLTRSEAAALLFASRRTRHLALFIRIALYTGARRGAILGLRWDQVDFDRGRIDFNEPGRPVMSKRRSVIPVPRQLLRVLVVARHRSNSPWIITRRGNHMADVKKSFGEARARAGLGPEVTTHVLRHTAGTWLAQAGVDLHQVAGWLGHTSARTTELYAHHHPDYFGKAKAAMERR